MLVFPFPFFVAAWSYTAGWSKETKMGKLYVLLTFRIRHIICRAPAAGLEWYW